MTKDNFLNVSRIIANILALDIPIIHLSITSYTLNITCNLKNFICSDIMSKISSITDLEFSVREQKENELSTIINFVL
jgi:hypothetical protein